MTESIGIRRLRRTLVIHRIVQVALIGLLIYMVLHFQQLFQEKYDSLKPFWNSVILTVLVQVGVFFPIRKLAEKEALREVGAAIKEKFTGDAAKEANRWVAREMRKPYNYSFIA